MKFTLSPECKERLFLSVIGLLVVVLVGWGVRDINNRFKGLYCQMNLHGLSAGLSMYLENYDDRLPLKENWNDALLLNYSTEPFRCPAQPDQRSSYAYNAYLSGKPYSKIASHARTVVFFETAGGWNRSGGPELAAYRHRGGMNVSFLDGHTSWVSPADRLKWKP